MTTSETSARRNYQNFVSAGYSTEQIQTKVSIRDFLMPVTITVQMVGRFSSFRDSRTVPTLRHPWTRRTTEDMAMYCTVLTPNRDCFTEHTSRYLVSFCCVHAVEKDHYYRTCLPIYRRYTTYVYPSAMSLSAEIDCSHTWAAAWHTHHAICHVVTPQVH